MSIIYMKWNAMVICLILKFIFLSCVLLFLCCKWKQKRGKITILVGCGAASLGDWCPVYIDRVLISFSMVKMFITRTCFEMSVTTFTTPHRTRMENWTTLLQKPKNSQKWGCFQLVRLFVKYRKLVLVEYLYIFLKVNADSKIITKNVYFLSCF
jgi:hypothetical protein